MALWYRIQPDPFKEMGRIQREMNKMFDSVDNSENRLIPSSDSPVERFWSPSIDVREDDNALTFHAEIPGQDREWGLSNNQARHLAITTCHTC